MHEEVQPLALDDVPEQIREDTPPIARWQINL